MKQVLLTAVLALLLCWPAWGQTYGVGANINAGMVDPANMNLDVDWPQDGGWGAWDSWGINVTEYLWEGPTERDGLDIWSDMRVRWAPDTLYLFLNISRWDGHEYVFPENDPWEGDHILVGIDPTLEGDDAFDNDWAGWPMNAPDNGPYVLKISQSQGITLNWGFNDAPDPVAEGWVRGNVARFDDEFEGTVYRYFGVRLAIYVPGLDADSQIGFNIGGSFSAMGTASQNNNWFAWRPTWEDYDEGRYPREPVAGHLQRYGDSYGTVTAHVPAVKDFYGTGVELTIPYVAPGTITLDGNTDEEVWNQAVVLSFINDDFYWDGGWAHDIGADGPDFEFEVRLLYTDGRLLVGFVYAHYEEVYFARDSGMGVLVGFDPIHEANVSDVLITGWDGFAYNDPNEAPVAFFINGDVGISLNWGSGDDPVDPVEAGFAEGVIWVSEDNFTWGGEIAIISDAIVRGTNVGFNVGGVAGFPDAQWGGETDTDYAWFSWQTCDRENPPVEGAWCGAGGTILQTTAGYGSLVLGGGVSVEETPGQELPTDYRLAQNFPNPFNPATTIEYGVPHNGLVTLEVYNALGQRVATLIDGQRTAGTYSVRWDAETLPSGMYLYRLQVDGNTVATRKMVLMK